MKTLRVGPDEDDNAEFGYLLQTYREEAGFTRASAAEAFGLSPEYIRLIEKGKRTPAAGNMRRILNVYGIDAVERLRDRVVMIGDIRVEFTGRILEARVPDVDQERVTRTRSERQIRQRRIGSIVEKLILVDEETLKTIDELLQDWP